MYQGVEPAVTYDNLGLPPEWYGAVEWVFPTWARTHALDTGQAVNLLKGAIVTVDRILTVSKVIKSLGIFLLGGFSFGEIAGTAWCHIPVHRNIPITSTRQMPYISQFSSTLHVTVFPSGCRAMLGK